MRPSLLKQLFGDALSLPASGRAAFLDEACRGDQALRDELASLLRYHEQGPDFLDQVHGALDSVSLINDSLLQKRYEGYETESIIAEGGMGVVLRARSGTGDAVAIKVQPPHLAGDANTRARFEREAGVTSRLQHPALCKVLETGLTEDGSLFVVMPLYGGETLRERLRRGPLPLAEAIEVLMVCAEGLLAAHQVGIVHRDVKPGNIMLTPTGPIILDFGLARLMDASRLTATGTVLGTAAYMSPEQLRAQSVDWRTDIWSLGVVAFEMLAGTRPFGEVAAHEVARAILEENPDSLPASVPRELQSAVSRMLVKEKEKRLAGLELLPSLLGQGS
ncbi:MAG: serine/threonine protein kinase [Rhodothermales bacterium]|nr:serine/threonine protein kinase [Rhodothermales bacterium]MBO6779010.1 serine/threonine protein kinase [Rhodothermales bacterium]